MFTYIIFHYLNNRVRHGDVTMRDGTATMRRKISKLHEN